MIEQLIGIERSGHCLEITLDKPAKRNAIDRRMADLLDAALNELDDDPGLRVGVLRSSGSVFSAGSDLNAIGDYMTTRGGEYGLLRRRRRKPLIAVVEGPAVGGGMEIVLSCDLVVASTSASFALPEVVRGVVPGLAIFAAVRALPVNIARELELTGLSLDAARAHQLGLVNRLTEPGEAVKAARALADVIARNAPLSVSGALQATNDYITQDESIGWALAERARHSIVDSEDAAEGVAAFMEKREPRWSAR